MLTPVIKNMIEVSNILLSTMESMNRKSENLFNTKSLIDAKNKLNDINFKFNEIPSSIEQAKNKQNEFNNNINQGNKEAVILSQTIKNLTFGLGAVFSIKKTFGFSDEISNINARLRLMSENIENVGYLQSKLNDIAKRTGGQYKNISDNVASLGASAKNTFKNNDEILQFTENLNKMFKTSGTSQTGIESTMYNLTQALSTGVLRGQDLNSVMQNTPQIVQLIADHMGITVGKVKELASQGKITGEVVKNSLLSATDQINEDFSKIPMGFGNVMNQAFTKLIEDMKPVFEILSNISNFIYDNYDGIAPIIYGIASAFLAYKIALIATEIAQNKLNFAMLASPLFIIPAIIGILIAFFFKWAQSIGGVSIAFATLKIWGLNALDTLGTVAITTALTISTAFEHIIVVVGTAIQGFVNGSVSLINSGLSHIESFVNGAIDMFNKFIAGINKFVDTGVSAISKVSLQVTYKMEELDAVKQAKQNIENVKKEIENYKNESEIRKNQRKNELNNVKLKNVFGSGSGSVNNSEIINNIPNDLSDIAKSGGRTANNTGRMADSMETLENELKFMKDVSSQKIYNRSYQPIINVNFGDINNNINNNMDLDGITNYVVNSISNGINEFLATGMEGVPLNV